MTYRYDEQMQPARAAAGHATWPSPRFEHVYEVDPR